MRDARRWLAGAFLAAAVMQIAVLAPVLATTPATTPDDPEIIPPSLIAKSQSAPVYPPAALAGRFAGEVEVKAMVSPDGEVAKITIVECTHPNLGFEEATEKAVSTWKFNPARQGGEVIPYELNFRIAFRWRGEGRAYVTSGDLAGARSLASTNQASPSQVRLDARAERSRGRGPGGL